MLQKYKNHSPRCYSWDYGKNGTYFITICTKNRTQFFGEISSGKMVLSNCGCVAEKFWLEIPLHFPFVKLDSYSIMPDHIHGLITLNKPKSIKNISELQDSFPVVTGQCSVATGKTDTILNSTTTRNLQPIGSTRFQNPGKKNVSSIIGSYKSICSKTIHLQYPEINFNWQPRFYDHIVRNMEEFRCIESYIKNNPANWPQQ